MRNRRHTFTNATPTRDGFEGDRSQRRSMDPHRGGKQNRGGRKLSSFNPSQFINTHPVDTTEDVFTPKHAFHTLGLDARLVRTIVSLGMASPTPIQDRIIPEMLAGRDVIGLAETGTGKTAAFLIPLIEKTLANRARQTLILAPTRELVLQIEAEFRRLSYGLNLYSASCVGGMNIGPQIRALSQKNHFIIATPGRMLDLLHRKVFHPQVVTTVVLDEADRMLDMGFIRNIREILSPIPKNRETHFFSATTSDQIKRLAHDFLRDPVMVSVKKKDVIDSIEQNVIPYAHDEKFQTLLTELAKSEFGRVIVFGSMKHSVEKLSRQLAMHGIRAESIHGNKNHSQRQRALQKFKTGDAQVLVATDVAARGIHVSDVTHVINYDLPNTFEDYVHRIGRTGRASKRGKALTFVPA